MSNDTPIKMQDMLEGYNKNRFIPYTETTIPMSFMLEELSHRCDQLTLLWSNPDGAWIIRLDQTIFKDHNVFNAVEKAYRSEVLK